MITVLAVLVHHLLGIAGVAADEVASRVQEDRRHAAAGKVELVAPEEEALVGLDIRRDGHVLFPGGVAQKHSQIGRASCRERVEMWAGAGRWKKEDRGETG